jgi:hypothetical protein
MAEEIEELWSKLVLSEEESGEMILARKAKAESLGQAQFSLLVKLFTLKTFNIEAFKTSLRSQWKMDKMPLVRQVGANLFMFVFHSVEALERVLFMRPWSYDKHLVLIKRFEGDAQPQSVQFTHESFWIRVHNLPIKSMTQEVGENIGMAIGKVDKVDIPPGEMGWGRFLRIRVSIDITKPLPRGKRVRFEEDEAFWVFFQYERLPTFCYRCGKLGHSDKDCHLNYAQGLSGEGSKFQFGSWLRSPPLKLLRGSPSDQETPINRNVHAVPEPTQAQSRPEPDPWPKVSNGIEEDVPRMRQSRLELDPLPNIPNGSVVDVPCMRQEVRTLDVPRIGEVEQHLSELAEDSLQSMDYDVEGTESIPIHPALLLDKASSLGSDKFSSLGLGLQTGNVDSSLSTQHPLIPWKRRARLNPQFTSLETVKVYSKDKGKRALPIEFGISESHTELPAAKVRKLNQETDGVSPVLVEAVVQPHQLQ